MKMTLAIRSVLEQVLKADGAEWYGLQLAGAAGLATGTVYPILARLRQAGWIEARWEDRGMCQGGRPPRCYYRLTPAGAAEAREALGRAARPRSRPAAEPGPWCGAGDLTSPVLDRM